MRYLGTEERSRKRRQESSEKNRGLCLLGMPSGAMLYLGTEEEEEGEEEEEETGCFLKLNSRLGQEGSPFGCSADPLEMGRIRWQNVNLALSFLKET